MEGQTPFDGPKPRATARGRGVAKSKAAKAQAEAAAPAEPKRRLRGFEPASRLLKEKIRTASETRGFAVSKLVTHWAEVVGEDIARMALPVKIGYGREGFGASLTLLTMGAAAPLVQMRAEQIREKVNAVYGYNAISKVVVTQTAPTGFAEGQVRFAAQPKKARPAPSAQVVAAARETAHDVSNPALRAALERLAVNVFQKAEQGRTTERKD